MSGSPVENASSHCDFFDTLPDDIVLSILAKLGSTAGCPADFVSVLSTCKSFNGFSSDSLLLFAKSRRWSSVHGEGGDSISRSGFILARRLYTFSIPLPHLVGPGCPLLSDFGCNIPAPTPHPANRFLADWFAGKPTSPELRVCSYGGCGRLETRRHEFRRCSVCGDVNYCSRACQALDWK